MHYCKNLTLHNGHGNEPELAVKELRTCWRYGTQY